MTWEQSQVCILSEGMGRMSHFRSKNKSELESLIITFELALEPIYQVMMYNNLQIEDQTVGSVVMDR